jgi:hypothetical protein
MRMFFKKNKNKTYKLKSMITNNLSTYSNASIILSEIINFTLI